MDLVVLRRRKFDVFFFIPHFSLVNRLSVLRNIFVFVFSSNVFCFYISGKVSVVCVMIDLIIVLYILELASIPVLWLRPIVIFSQSVIFAGFLVCSLISSSTSLSLADITYQIDTPVFNNYKNYWFELIRIAGAVYEFHL